MASSRDDRPVQDVEDLEESLRSLDERNKVLHDSLITLGVDYANKIVGDFSDKKDKIFQLRDRILYRRNSLRFHLTLLLRTHNHAVSELHSEGRDEDVPAGAMIMDRSAEQQFAIFDSILFHSISLFDYLGGLIQYLCSSQNRHKWDWDSAATAARHDENKVSNSPVAEVVERLDKWVTKLYGHRADVIHNEPDLGGRTLSHDLVQDRYDLKVFAPSGFIDQFDELKSLSETHAITLHYVGLWLCKKTVDGAIRVIQGLRDHLEQNREVPPEDEPIKFKPPEE